MDIEKLREKYSKNKEVLSILSEVEALLSVPYYEGFVAIKTQLLTWEGSLREHPVILDGAEDKSFERAHKFLTELKPYYDQLEYFRSKLTSVQLSSAEAEAKSAYQIALQNRKGEGTSR